jgi:5-formyltetrahydrofolate cyclo-ligase
VDTGFLNRTVLEKGKRLVVPFIDTGNHVIMASELKSIDDLVMGPYGIHVPRVPLKVSLGEIDLIIVPGVAFDKKNMRLGRGKGYYDRFLAKPELSLAETVGLAFQFQVVDNLPSDPHDKPVSRVMTDRSPVDQRIF